MTRTLKHKLGYTWKYLAEERGFIRSILPNRKRKYPYNCDYTVVADLHCHLYIEDFEDFEKIVNKARKNKIELIGWTAHVGNDEVDYWGMKEHLRKSNFGYSDRDLAVFIWEDGEPFVIVGNYETEVRVKGLKNGAMVDMLALMPDKGFENEVRSDMPLDEFLGLSREYNAIPFGGHVCALSDPNKKIEAFRSPDEDEIEILKEEVILKIAGSDEVSDAAMWMCYSWKQDKENFGYTLRSSDAHTEVVGSFLNFIPRIRNIASWYLRNEIGRAYSILLGFSDIGELGGEGLREKLEGKIRDKNYVAGGSFTPAGQFFLGTALPNLLG